MDDHARNALAGWIAEALETGRPIAPLPDAAIPADAAEGEEVAGAALEAAGLIPCGLRLAPGPDGTMLCGPMLEGRLLPDGGAIAAATAPHPRISAAVVGVLAEALDPASSAPAVFAALHPALDIAASRFRDGPVSPGCCAADLAGLGFVVAGTRRRPPDRPVTVSCSAGPGRPRGRPVDLAAAFAPAAAAARRMGGLPAGALLVVGGLGSVAVPLAGEQWVARIGRLGTARAMIG